MLTWAHGQPERLWIDTRTVTATMNPETAAGRPGQNRPKIHPGTSISSGVEKPFARPIGRSGLGYATGL
jgi:hypothetical protein